MTSAVREEHDEHDQGSGPIKVTILASEWGSSKGGLSTINRELAIQLAKFPDVEITFFLPKCSEQDKKEAVGHKINIVEATRRPGYEELEWLSFPPEHLEIDVIVGHGVKLGRQAQVIRDSHKCKWVQVVHTDPEELGMFKSYSNPISKGEEKHNIEVELCEMSDFVVGVGPKLTEACHSYLRRCPKHQTVFDFTPSVLDEFLSVQQVPEERKPFRILVFGRGDAEDFVLKGFDIAGKAVASLPDTHLVFVGAPDGKHEEIKQRLLDCGISASRLRVRGYISSRESLKHLFCEVDTVLMPSRTEGFGLTGLEALSAGLPVLVSKNSGFGEALSKVPFGSSLVIDSEDPKVWATAIKNIEDKDRQSRLEEAKVLCSIYKKKYSWAKQSKDLLERMITMVHDFSSSFQRSTDAQISQHTEVTTEHHTDSSSSCQGSTHSSAAPRLPVRMDCEIVPQNANVTPQQVLCRIADRYLQIEPPSTLEECVKFLHYLQEVRSALVVDVRRGSLIITLECRSLQILDGLWTDYCSGHLSEMAQKYLVTDDILQETDLVEVKLITTILEEDYRACRDYFLQFPAAVSLESNQMETEDSGVKMEMEDIASALRDVKIDEPDIVSQQPCVEEESPTSEASTDTKGGATTGDTDEGECSEYQAEGMKGTRQSETEESPKKDKVSQQSCVEEESSTTEAATDTIGDTDEGGSSEYQGEVMKGTRQSETESSPKKDWDSFEQKCLSILNQCSSEELERMNRRLSDVIPGVKLETDVQDPYGLFSLMVNAELLSPDNLYFLDTLLPSIRRENLERELLKDQQFGEKVREGFKSMKIEMEYTGEKLRTSTKPGEESKDKGVLPVSSEGISAWMDTYITSIITSEGGEVAVKGVKLVCPPGAVNKPVTITLSLEDPAKHYGRIVEKDLENDVMIAAPVINLQPNGLLFKKSVTLTTNFEMKDFKCDDVLILEGTEARDRKIVWRDITQDTKLSMLDDKSAEVIIEIEHFTLYEILCSKSRSFAETVTRFNSRTFNYTMSALHNKNSINEELALLFVSQEVYHQQSYKENETSALVQLQNEGFTELHVRSTDVQEENRICNNDKLHISVHLEQDYNLDDSQEECICITVNSHLWWKAGEVKRLRLKYTEDARILCGKISIKKENGHTSERQFSETDICGYVRSLLGVEKAIYNLMPIAAKLLETPDQAKNGILKSWKDDDAQLEIILKHRFNKDDLAIADLAVLREALEGLRKNGSYRVTQRGQMYIRYLRHFATKTLGVQCMHEHLMQSFSSTIDTVCKTILRDCCIELEGSAETVEKEASFTTHVEYLEIREVVTKDIAEKYQQICSSSEKSITTFNTNVPHLIQNIKEIFVDAKISPAQNGLNGLSEETLEQFKSTVLRAVENNKLEELSLDVVCEILYQLCLSNCGNRPTTEIKRWNESLSILIMLEFLKQFFQHCPQDVKLYKRLDLFVGRQRDIMSGRVEDEFSMLDYSNLARSLIHFAKFDASKMVRFELRDSKRSPVSSASGDIQYDKNHKTFSQQFFIKNETELQLHAFARVHVDGHVQEKGGRSIKLVGGKHLSLRLVYVCGSDEVTIESDVSENLSISSDNGASMQAKQLLGEPVPRKNENSAGGSVQDSLLRNAQPTAGTSAEKSCGAMRLKRTFSASCSMSTPKRTKLTAPKEGKPSEDELEELSEMLELSWEKLARRLGFHRGEITGFDKDNEELSKKAFKMLIRWKEKEGADATYSVLYGALCNKPVQRKDLAERFCCN